MCMYLMHVTIMIISEQWTFWHADLLFVDGEAVNLQFHSTSNRWHNVTTQIQHKCINLLKILTFKFRSFAAICLAVTCCRTCSTIFQVYNIFKIFSETAIPKHVLTQEDYDVFFENLIRYAQSIFLVLDWHAKYIGYKRDRWNML